MSDVFVLGAGFTKAFAPEAPLLVDDYGVETLLKKFEAFPHARAVLEQETARAGGGRVDLERLLTRLDSTMPYDSSRGAVAELALLFAEVKAAFRARLTAALQAKTYPDELKRFGSACIQRNAQCLTFNYDDMFDQALWHGGLGSGPWHPDGGYGFFCKPSSDCVRDFTGYKDQTEILLLKLHGSVNWRPRLGSVNPIRPDSIVHHEVWYLKYDPYFQDLAIDDIERHLEAEPLIVPPVLVKGGLANQPVLQTVWSLAFQVLTEATRVFFLGYSMPITDVAAGTLFAEAIRANASIVVVNLEDDEERQKAIERAFVARFRKGTVPEFVWQDARDWCNAYYDEVFPSN